MALSVKPFSEIVSDQVSSIQGQMTDIQFPEGSFELALVESNAGMTLWLQAIMLQVAAQIYASSSTGTALDTWMAQFGFIRNGATQASGLETFARNTTTTQGLVQVNALVSTQVGSIQYKVYQDSTNPNWNPSLGGYVLAPSVNEIEVPIQAVVAGSSGNASPGAINTIISSIVGIDSVTNDAAFINGQDQETDASFRARFINYINSLYAGTLLAYETAITNGTPAIFYKIAENKDFNLATQYGMNSIFIDDGSGDPPDSLIDSILEKINAVRGLSIQNGVYAASPLTANMTLTIEIDPAFNQAQIIEAITFSVTNYVGLLNVGQPIIFTKLYQLIYQASSGVIEASNLLINGVAADLVPTLKQRAYMGTFVISVS